MANIYSIVVTFNGAQWIEKCLDSLLKSTIPTKIVIIDNNSTDNTLEIIEAFNTQVELIQTGQNMGFGKANNIGIQKALEYAADYVFLLNQDAWIEPDTIEKLLQAAISNPEYGILSPIHLNGLGKLIDNLLYKNLTKHPCGRELFSDLYNKSNKDKIYEITYVNAACWLLSKECIKIVGLFDPIFEHYGEDNNYCHRVEYHKFKIGIMTCAKIYHDREIRLDRKEIWKDNPELEVKLSLANILNKNFKQSYYTEIKKSMLILIKSVFKGDRTTLKYSIKKINLIKRYSSDLKKSYQNNSKPYQF